MTEFILITNIWKDNCTGIKKEFYRWIFYCKIFLGFTKFELKEFLKMTVHNSNQIAHQDLLNFYCYTQSEHTLFSVISKKRKFFSCLIYIYQRIIEECPITKAVFYAASFFGMQILKKVIQTLPCA